MSKPIHGPGAIDSPGDYHLANDIHVESVQQLTANAALHVDVPNVRIDMNGKQVLGVGLLPGVLSFGILGNSAGDFVVFDGAGGGTGGVTGFRIGIGSATPRTRILDVVIVGSFHIGCMFNAPQARAERCTIEGIGGYVDEAYAIGINVGWSDTEIRGNVIRNIYRQTGAPAKLVGEGVAVNLCAGAANCLVEGNRIENDEERPNTIGVFAGEGGASTVLGNRISGYMYGIMAGGTTDSPVLARGNTVRRRALNGSIGISAKFGLVEDNLIAGYDMGIDHRVPQGRGNTILPS